MRKACELWECSLPDQMQAIDALCRVTRRGFGRFRVEVVHRSPAFQRVELDALAALRLGLLSGESEAEFGWVRLPASVSSGYAEWIVPVSPLVRSLK